MNLGDLQEPAVHEDVEQLEALEPPYKVFVHNDNVTPYDFVVMALLRFFGLTSLEAEQVTYTAHVSGVAYVTTLPRYGSGETGGASPICRKSGRLSVDLHYRTGVDHSRLLV